MNITFCGANREVTGSCYCIQTEHARIIVDCGTFQGGKYAEDKNHLPFPFDPKAADALVVTHAHFDHTGRIPKLYKEGFRGKIWCTAPTSELAMLNLRDAAHLMAEEAEHHHHPPLYDMEDVEPLQDLWRPVPYHTLQEIAPNVYIYLSDAGHILGSASVSVHADGQIAVFSGDLGNTPVPLLRSTQHLEEADVVIVESTYGNRVHEPSDQRYTILRDAILDTVKKGGALLIPAFALERTQELIYELHHLHSTGQIPKVPIFLDSPLGIAATEVFQNHLDYFNTEAKAELEHGMDLFHFPGVTYTQGSMDSKNILHVRGPKIIIAGSGMMNGGRILHHLKNYLGSPTTNLLIIGYQVEGSLGRQLHDGARKVHIYGEAVDVAATVKSFGAFSGHADYPRLMNWLHGFVHQAPHKIFVTHGELNSALSFSQSIEDQLGIASGVPEYGDSISVSMLGSHISTRPELRFAKTPQ